MPGATPNPSQTPVPRDDVKAALAAFAELGPQYSDEVVDSFLEKLNERMAPAQRTSGVQVVRDRWGDPVRDKHGRVQFAPAGATGAAARPRADLAYGRRGGSGFGRQVAILSIILGAAIPITIVGIVQNSILAVFIAWVGICIVSIAQAWAARGD